MTKKQTGLFLFCILLPISQSRADDPDKIRFGRDIQPILSHKCYFCHGPDPNHREADLRLDTKEGAIDSGAIVPDEPDDSLLIERILSDDESEQVPPPESGRVLSESKKNLLTRWIKEGGVWEDHWAFSAPQRRSEPTVKNPEWCRNPVDAFVLARLPYRRRQVRHVA